MRRQSFSVAHEVSPRRGHQYGQLLANLVLRVRRRRWPQLFVVITRILLAFAFVPAGLKKVLYQPFTDPQHTGVFHEFLHAFYATGAFYQFVGAVQLFGALLLLSQRFAAAGAFIFTPILTVIMVFCWSTHVYPTAVVVTLMFLAALGLLLWDIAKLPGLLSSYKGESGVRIAHLPSLVDLKLWAGSGLFVVALYLVTCVAQGEVYRPKGAELDTPAFYVFPLMLLSIAVTFIIDEVRYRRAVKSDRLRTA